jgi:hypothetical protein
MKLVPIWPWTIMWLLYIYVLEILKQSDICPLKHSYYMMNKFYFLLQHFGIYQVLFHLNLLRYVKDQFLQSWFSGWEECHKLNIYKEYKVEFCVKKYLDFHIIVQLLTKLRSDTLKLNVETGKYQNVARENRICSSYNNKVQALFFFYS